MTFTKNSAIARSYAVLILANEITIEQVPDIFNMRQAVMEILGLK